MAMPQYLGAFLPAWGHHVASRAISWHVALVGIMKQTLFSHGFLHTFGWTGSASSEVPSAVHRPSPRRLKAPKHYAATSATRNHRPRATRTPISNGAAFGATGATTNCAAEDKTCWGMAGGWRIVNSTYSILSIPQIQSQKCWRRGPEVEMRYTWLCEDLVGFGSI